MFDKISRRVQNKKHPQSCLPKGANDSRRLNCGCKSLVFSQRFLENHTVFMPGGAPKAREVSYKGGGNFSARFSSIPPALDLPKGNWHASGRGYNGSRSYTEET
jgi:hypothetical protein